MEGVCGHAKGLLKPPKGKKMPAKGVTNKQLSGCLAALTSLLEAFGVRDLLLVAIMILCRRL